jgi:hypothetical protein
MTAGPVELPHRVRAALGDQIKFDYSEPFFDHTLRTRGRHVEPGAGAAGSLKLLDAEVPV